MKPFFRFSLILILALSTISAIGQTTPQQALNALQEGALVVKLIIPEKKIEMLLKQNNKEEAIRVEEETTVINQALITAFTSTYTYGQVYFVYSSEMHFIAEGDPGVMFDKNGEFATAYPKDWLYIELSESPERGIDGFVVRDRNSDVVPKPFPYFVSEWDAFHINKKTYPAMIEEWQKQLKKLGKRL